MQVQGDNSHRYEGSNNIRFPASGGDDDDIDDLRDFNSDDCGIVFGGGGDVAAYRDVILGGDTRHPTIDIAVVVVGGGGGRGVGDDGRAISSPRGERWGGGYKGEDFADWMDAHQCSGA